MIYKNYIVKGCSYNILFKISDSMSSYSDAGAKRKSFRIIKY